MYNVELRLFIMKICEIPGDRYKGSLNILVNLRMKIQNTTSKPENSLLIWTYLSLENSYINKDEGWRGGSVGKAQIPNTDADGVGCGNLSTTTNTSRQRQRLLGSVKDLTSVCKVERNWGRYLMSPSGLYTHSHTYIHKHLHTHVHISTFELEYVCIHTKERKEEKYMEY